MRSTSLLPLALVSLTLIAQASDTAKPEPVKWEEDWPTARELARKTGKPLFVVFRCER